MYDITYTSIGAAVVEVFYDENVVFLRFCFEKELLKKNPLDRHGRILRMVYLNQDLTNIGKNLFPELLDKFLVFTDRKGKTSLETMLKRWYTALEKEYRSQITGNCFLGETMPDNSMLHKGKHLDSLLAVVVP